MTMTFRLGLCQNYFRDPAPRGTYMDIRCQNYFRDQAPRGTYMDIRSCLIIRFRGVPWTRELIGAETRAHFCSGTSGRVGLPAWTWLTNAGGRALEYWLVAGAECNWRTTRCSIQSRNARISPSVCLSVGLCTYRSYNRSSLSADRAPVFHIRVPPFIRQFCLSPRAAVSHAREHLCRISKKRGFKCVSQPPLSGNWESANTAWERSHKYAIFVVKIMTLPIIAQKWKVIH